MILIASLVGSNHAQASSQEASASIMHGSPTTISKWPWQVAISLSWRFEGTSRDRTICGGVALAPRLVLTARHCVVGRYERWPRNLMVYSGKTWLNDSFSGGISWVSRIIRPRSPSWDVALLKLKNRVSAKTIKLASRSEYNTWRPGQVAYATGWGVTRHDGPMSRRLRVTKQVILPDGVCRRDRSVQTAFRPRLMVCHGSPKAMGSTCQGDSGGPLVVPVKTSGGRRYRLAGLTFYGNEYCWSDLPSVASRVSGDWLRTWIARNANWLTSAYPVGSGAGPVSQPVWCQVPDLEGLLVADAKRVLRAEGCFGARFEYDTWVLSRRRSVYATDPDEGWLLYSGARFDVRVAAGRRSSALG